MENAKIAPLHFTLELEGLRNPPKKKFEWMKNLHEAYTKSWLACNE